MIVVGSKALEYRQLLHILDRKTGLDEDFIATKEEFDRFLDGKVVTEYESSVMCDGAVTKIVAKTAEMIYECEVITEGSTAQAFEDLVKSDPETIVVNGMLVPSLDLLFTLKSSHKYLKNSPHFWKTAHDYHAMKKAGAKIRDKSFLKAREKETYWYKHPSLKQSKEDFFKDDNIQYVYDHDSIHKVVAIFDKPAYLYYDVEGQEVESSKEKFFNQKLEIRLAGVIEEAAVLAIERSLVPHPGVKTPKEAWLFALSKVCSSITSGWFREFAYEHLPVIVKLYPEGYWEKFKFMSEEGLVPLFKGKVYA